MMDENKFPASAENAEDKYSAFNDPVRPTEKKEKTGKMSKRTRTLLFTSIGAVTLAVAVLLVTLLPTPGTEGSASTGDTNPTVDNSVTLLDKTSEDESIVPVKQVAVTNKDSSYTIVYNEKAKLYQLKGYEDLMLEPDGTQTITGCIALIKASEKVAVVNSLAEVGLDAPVATVTGTYHDGSTATLLVGDETPSGESYYVSLQGEKEVYICSADAVTPFLANGESYVETTLLTAPEVKSDDSNGSPTLREVTLSGRSHPTPLTIRRKVNADGDEMAYYTYIITAPYKRGVSDEAANQLVTFYALEASQAVVLHPTDSQLESLGFKDPLTVMDLTLSVATTVSNDESSSTEQTENVEIMEFYNTTHATLTIGDVDEDGNYLVMLDGLDAIYLVPASNLSMVAGRTYDNTVTDLLYLKNILEVGKVAIGTEKGLHTFSLKHIADEDDRDKSLVVTEGDITYSTPEFRDLYQLMMSIERYDGLKEAPTVEPALSITIWDVDGLPYLSASFYPASGSLYHVRTSEGELFVTRASDITHFIRQANNLLEGKDVLIATE